MRRFWTDYFLTIFSFTFIVDFGDCVQCYNCASSEYESFISRDVSLMHKIRIRKFDRFCDVEDSIIQVAPVENCRSTCVTIFEPQYFGGLQSPHRPFLYMRGCAEHVFSVMERQPAEVHVLLRSPICVKLPLSQIYPSVQANEVVEVCSCDKDGCNLQTTNSSFSTFPIILFLLIVIQYSF
ncbi:unnamed protein product [Caenorhabditis angaria]|uniref:Uncharacterized protein n=1 Tax=Caenorhabditis angaria TaxID=860376 RepID=A0A9P1MWQ3_9PELO|nr:unnamed protein product [Caenorhabditis angaria]